MSTTLFLAKLIPPLLTFARSACKAIWSDGWGDLDVAALADLGKAVQATLEARPAPPPNTDVITAHRTLTAAAFATAYCRHWADNTALLKKQRKEAEARIRTALDLGPADESLAGGEAMLSCPTTTALYRALWAQFTDGDDRLVDPRDAHAFERDVRAAWSMLLETAAGQPVRRWLTGEGHAERARAIRTLLAWDTLTWRSRHVVGNLRRHHALPHMPLDAMYVEPATVERRGATEHTGTVQSWLDDWLSSDAITPAVVHAQFGHGKSLSARVFAARLAENWLRGDGPISQRPYPITVWCRDDLGSQEPDLGRLVARAMRRQLGPRAGLDVADPGLSLPDAEQRTVIILDGLDEVHLRPRERERLFEVLAERSCLHRRFVVFTRPAGLPGDDISGWRSVRLEGFDEPRANAWLERWQRFGRSATDPPITYDQLVERGVAELAATPILLFMAAFTWDDEGTLDQAGIYEAYFRRLARSKFEHDPVTSHPVVDEASRALLDALIREEWLPEDAQPIEAMMWLLGRIAWEHHRFEARDRALQRKHVRRLLDDELDLDAHGERLGSLVEKGLMLILQSDLGGEDVHIEYQHRSFREFLEARHWLWQIRRLGQTPEAMRLAEEKRLMGARLFAEESRSADFLLNLIAQVPEAERPGVVAWASRCVHDDRLMALDRKGNPRETFTMADDVRCLVREVALAVGCHLARSPFSLERPTTLATLAALFSLGGHGNPHLLAPNLSSPGARCVQATFDRASLMRADLSGANFSATWFYHPDFTAATLVRARFFETQFVHGAQFIDADLRHARFDVATLDYADMTGADLRDAVLGGVRGGAIDLTGAQCDGLVLRHARVTIRTRTPLEIDCDLSGCLIRLIEGDPITLRHMGRPERAGRVLLHRALRGGADRILGDLQPIDGTYRAHENWLAPRRPREADEGE